MAGFNPNKSRSVDIEIEDIDTDIEDDDDVDYEDDYRVKKSSKSNNRSGRGSNRSSSDSEDEDDYDVNDDSKIIRKRPNKKETDKSVIFIGAGVALVLVIGIVVFGISSSKKKADAEAQAKAQMEQQSKTNTSEQQNVSPGIPNFHGVGKAENDDKLYDPNLVTKDLNGNQVPTNYQVLDSETVTDYINYKKFRASTGNGLEFYWLEAEYKGQPYKVQVPYSVYSKLDESGITVVDMEVLTLENKSKMVTYMKVRENAKSLLEER